jgi:predicted O-linked N-acetylglucosamine transferase (SPINDLY family)
MYFYCTYFDHRYLPKGLALYESLRQHCQQFRLWVLCLDQPCFDVLTAMKLPNIEPILMKDFEQDDEALAKAKLDRTLVEYYFTCTPTLPLYIFKNYPEVDLVTYLDSDIFFFSDPSPIYDELQNHSIGIIEHRFPPKLESLKFNGIFNVGWVSFRKDTAGLECLDWWRDRCNEWCHDYHQDGKFADQKYLDDWPQRFERVAILQYPGINIAPWNLDTYPISLQNNQVYVSERPAIFFHFHGLKELEDGRFDLNVGFYQVEQINDAVMYAYRTYITTLQSTQANVSPYLPEASLTKTARFQKIPATEQTQIIAQIPTSTGDADVESFIDCSPRLEASQVVDIPQTITIDLAQLTQNPSDRQALTHLNQTRRSLADYLLRHSLDRLQTEWNQDLHKAYRAVWNSGLKNSPPDAADRAFIEQIATQASGDPRDSKTFQALLVAILYLYPHQLNIDPARIIVPNVFVPTYMEFMFESPRLFKTIGEVDRYHEYFAQWTQFIHQRTQANPSGDVERYLCQTYANAANLTPTYFSQHDPVTIQTQRAQIIEQYLNSQTTQLDYEFPPRPANRQKIRFGILSLNFNPSAETFTVLPIFEQLDRAKFEIHLFAFQSNNSETERYCRQHADRFTHLIHNHADRLVRMIRGADLDILLIGSNITARSYPITFVSAHRLARVQVSGISSSVTTALHNMDYYIGATLTTPPATAQRYYTETLVTLEGSGLCFSFPPVTDEATIAFDRTQLGLSDSTTVFMSGANFRKINPELRDTWAKLLARVPDSILVIYPFGPNWGLHPNLEMPFFNQMQLALQRHGVDLKRLLLIKTMPSVADVRSCLSQADVYLDSFPYSGAASAIDPLTVGVPFVSLEGREQRECQSSSLLHELGLPELVTSNESDYLDLAVKLASDRPLREQFRQRLLRQMSNNPPFLDKLGYAHKIEQLLTQLMSAWRPAASSTTVNLPSSANQAASTLIEEPVQML